jgi:hypothetical protein
MTIRMNYGFIQFEAHYKIHLFIFLKRSKLLAKTYIDVVIDAR